MIDEMVNEAMDSMEDGNDEFESDKVAPQFKIK